MIGTWVKPGVIVTVAFDDEKLTLELVKKTEIPHDEPISWMAFDVCTAATCLFELCKSHVADVDWDDSIRGRTSTARA